MNLAKLLRQYLAERPRAAFTADQLVRLLHSAGLVDTEPAPDSVFAGLGADYVESIVESNMWALTVMRELHPPAAPVDIPVLYVEADPPFSYNTWSGMLDVKQHVHVEYPHPQMLNPDAVRTWGPHLAAFLER